MHYVGLDFGTTNSILSYHHGQEVRTFRLGGASESDYIPSILAIDQEDGSLSVGNAAGSKIGDPNYQTFSRFKMLLSEQSREKLARYGYSKHSPGEIARQYIQHLTTRFQKEQLRGQTIQKMVVTAPEVWIREGLHTSRETLWQICTTLGIKQVKLLSEPVAACVYFAHQHLQQKKSGFQGHVLVCDCGGGTLDLSLCAVDGKQVKVLEGTGKGHSKDTLGQAGVAFDQAVLELVYARQNPPLISKEEYYSKHLQAFEQRKITEHDVVDRRLDHFCRNAPSVSRLFTIDQMPVQAKDLYDAFACTIKKPLSLALQEMQNYLLQRKIDTEDSSCFRILLVGGFSRFYLVRRTIQQFFDNNLSHDDRLSDFTLEDTALAISKGAALVANDLIDIDNSCPINIGFHGFDPSYNACCYTILRKGQPLAKYKKAQYSKQWFASAGDKAFQQELLRLFVEIDHQRHDVTIATNNHHQLAMLLPNPDQGNKWQIGFSVNEDLLFQLHVRDVSGQVKTTAIGDLISNLGLKLWDSKNAIDSE